MTFSSTPRAGEGRCTFLTEEFQAQQSGKKAEEKDIFMDAIRGYEYMGKETGSHHLGREGEEKTYAVRRDYESRNRVALTPERNAVEIVRVRTQAAPWKEPSMHTAEMQRKRQVEVYHFPYQFARQKEVGQAKKRGCEEKAGLWETPKKGDCEKARSVVSGKFESCARADAAGEHRESLWLGTPRNSGKDRGQDPIHLLHLHLRRPAAVLAKDT
ncbi:hypothetical protein DFH08DRAFT_814872 [Mycena albidolilacea]|uniref:Uncharacterized protein n=1 Tax=Mycena albidolilacea TaxID=1033008 RepID=A0AAD6ZQG1_9AGAR|nr:hypothetical protein DFH08DRAFT_814872 [Mycena albidolilacea]